MHRPHSNNNQYAKSFRGSGGQPFCKRVSPENIASLKPVWHKMSDKPLPAREGRMSTIDPDSVCNGDIMIVDDTTTNVKLLSEILTGAGYRVRTAGSGETALRGVRDKLPALILLDIRMPGIDGYEVCRRLKEDERTRAIPVIFVSVLGEEPEKVKGFRVGAVDYITWPFHREEVLARINTHLTLRSVQLDLERLTANSEERARFLACVIDHSSEPFHVAHPDGRLGFVNTAFCDLTGFSEDELRRIDWREDLTSTEWRETENRQLAELVRTGKPVRYEKEYIRKDGARVPVELLVHVTRDRNGRPIEYYSFVNDLTERRRLENERAEFLTCLQGTVVELTRVNELLKAEIVRHHETRARQDVALAVMKQLDRPVGRLESIGHILELLGEFTGVDAAAIRLRDGEDFPYYVLDGFADSFVEAEKYLCARDASGEIVRDSQGKPYLECLCGNVIMGGTDPSLPFFTQGGSFWTNSTTELLASTTEEDLPACMRNRCNEEGYESVALIPVKSEDEIVGLLQLNDRRPNRLTLDMIHFLEEVGASIGIALRRGQMRDALMESEEKYRTLFDSSRDPIFSTTLDGRLVMANQSFLDLFGLTEEEAKDIDIRTAYSDPADREKFRKEIEEKGSVKDYAVKFLCKDRTEIDCLITATLRRGGDGSILGYQGTIRDVTEQKRHENTIREQRAFLSDILESVTHPFYVVDADNYTVIMANSAARAGFSSGESTCYGLTHGRKKPCNTSEHPCPLEEMKKTGTRVRVEQTNYDAKGDPRTVVINAYPVLDQEGRLRYMVEYVVDVTGRKNAEQERVRLMTAIEQSAEIILITDADGTIQYANAAVEAATGYSRAEVIGRNLRIFNSDTHTKASYDNMWKTVTNGDKWNGHLINKRKDGTLYEEEASISPVRDESGKIVNYVAVKRDLTQEAILQKQLFQAQKMESIGTLAGGLAHDFNNILTVVLGFCELLLLDRQEGAQDYADLETIARAARNGADLVKRILAFSRQAEPSLRPVDLNHEVLQAWNLLDRTIPKMVAIEPLLADNLMRINADPGQIEQVLLNLAVNARDSMPEGGKIVIKTHNVTLDEEYCATQAEAKPGVYVLLTMSDTGYGMDKYVLEHIFEPFYTTKELGKGTGLGLAMVYGIVKSHGGHVECYSEPGVGTRFKLYFPAIDAEEKAVVASTQVTPALGTETILLVDDDEQIRELAKRLLSGAGYKVLTAGNGKEALHVYRTRRDEISLVILDLLMPEMGGKQCLEELMQIDPHAKVLIASGYSLDNATAKTLERGARGFVGKPYHVKEFIRTVRQVLDAD